MNDPTAEGQNIFGLAKSNLGRLDLPTLTYRLEEQHVGDDPDDGRPITTVRVAWAGESEVTVRTAMSMSPEDRDAIPDAAEWLRERIDFEGGSVLASVAIRDGVKAGYAERTLKRARERINAESTKRGFPAVPVWHWPGAALREATDTPARTVAPLAPQPPG